MFAYSFTIEVTQGVRAAMVVMSSAKIKDLSDNSLRVIVQKTYADCDIDQQIIEQARRRRAGASDPLVLVAFGLRRSSVKRKIPTS